MGSDTAVYLGNLDAGLRKNVGIKFSYLILCFVVIYGVFMIWQKEDRAGMADFYVLRYLICFPARPALIDLRKSRLLSERFNL